MEQVDGYKMEIITGLYQKAPSEQKAMVQSLFGENAEYKYALYFHWYNVIHELGHGVMMFNAPSCPHPAEEEQLVNDFAVAYWRQFGEREKVEGLWDLVSQTVRKFHAPAEGALGYMDYGKEKWGQEELNNFNNYGWFQFSSVLQALSSRRGFWEVLAEMGILKARALGEETFAYKVDGQMAYQVVKDGVRALKGLGVKLPRDIKVVLGDDVNCHRCQVERK